MPSFSKIRIILTTTFADTLTIYRPLTNGVLLSSSSFHALENLCSDNWSLMVSLLSLLSFYGNKNGNILKASPVTRQSVRPRWCITFYYYKYDILLLTWRISGGLCPSYLLSKMLSQLQGSGEWDTKIHPTIHFSQYIMVRSLDGVISQRQLTTNSRQNDELLLLRNTAGSGSGKSFLHISVLNIL